MKLKHKIKINIADRNGHKQEVLQSEHRSIPKRLLTFLFGEFCEVLVLTPGESVQGIEISSDERKTRGKKRKMSGGFPGINSSKRNDNSQIVETEQKRMFWQSPLS